MESLSRVQEQARSAGRGESGDHFLADQTGFTHAAYRCTAFATKDQFYRALEFTIQAIGKLADGLRLGAERFFGNRKVIHGDVIVP
ncbi:hypothetical protein AN403_5468 [Pseudomonas fluorescens]|uniref:Uncharacterized protein n=1 Tax=Pseudomonas fluorescens TaxID=294 RepID=A0A0P8X5F4_PSEFL|nr:hypothetical protein AN403_5468 [Pseudomonas fluorescens]